MQMRRERQVKATTATNPEKTTKPPSLVPTFANLVYRTPVAGIPETATSLDFYAPALARRVPLVIFVHGGGWQIGDKKGGELGHPRVFVDAGYAYASANYRLLQYGKPEIAADDIAAAIAYLRSGADKFGIDPDRIILMGHSAGAHLAALVGLDGHYLANHDVPKTSIRALILLDGAGYDIATQVKNGRNGDLYRTVFGNDPAYWSQMSPITYAGTGDAPATLAHYVATRNDSALQSQALVNRINAAGGRAQASGASGKSHETINREFGYPGDVVTEKSLAFLADIFD